MAELTKVTSQATSRELASSALKVTVYKTTDGTLFDSLDEARLYQAGLDISGKNPAIREEFFTAAKKLPKYGKHVEESLGVFVREVGNITPWRIIQDLCLNYSNDSLEAFRIISKK